MIGGFLYSGAGVDDVNGFFGMSAAACLYLSVFGEVMHRDTLFLSAPLHRRRVEVRSRS